MIAEGKKRKERKEKFWFVYLGDSVPTEEFNSTSAFTSGDSLDSVS